MKKEIKKKIAVILLYFGTMILAWIVCVGALITASNLSNKCQ
jgi:hypothetical protein